MFASKEFRRDFGDLFDNRELLRGLELGNGKLLDDFSGNINYSFRCI